ncbi:MAG: hypothetical protein ACLGHN_11465 [Bacteriovoracia bacterium]
MKNILILLFCLLSFNVFSATEVDVLSAEYPVEDFDQRKTLCLTVIRLPLDGKLLGVIESIEDCYYARAAKKSPDHKILLDLNKLHKIDHPEMAEHLQKLDGQLEFYFSDGD